MMVTYGLCKNHINAARILVETGKLKHDTMLRFLKVVYEGRKHIHNSLHAEDK